MVKILYNLQRFFYLRLFLIKRHFSAISAIIGATFNAISAIFSAIGVIGINLTSINIDTQIHFATNKLRLLQSGSFYFVYNSWNAASPMLDQIHVSKSY
jgi:hypothetical protein